jgi:hypothetical protein
MANLFLEKLNHTERIDHRSYERQGIEQIPTIHLGVTAAQMERRGIRTERGNINRQIEVSNRDLRRLKGQIISLQKWLKEQTENTEPPTLADIITGILERREREGNSRYYSIGNLKQAAEMLNFLTANHITDLSGLDVKLKDAIGKQLDLSDSLKKIERRVKVLDEHIRHSGNFKANRKFKAQYEKLYAQYTTLENSKGFGVKRKAQKALAAVNEYYEEHSKEITSYNNAERYLKEVMQKHFDPNKLPPITMWTNERNKLTAERAEVNSGFAALKADVQKAERMRKAVNQIMREEQHREQPTRKHAHGMEL